MAPIKITDKNPMSDARMQAPNPAVDDFDEDSPSLSPSEPPILIWDDNEDLVAAIKLESVTVTDTGLSLHGWTLGSPRIALLCNEERVACEFSRYQRQDVLQALSIINGFDPGFQITLHNPSAGEYRLRWYVDMNNRVEAFDFILDIELPSSSPPPRKMREKGLTGSADSRNVAGKPIKSHDFESVIRLNNGIIVVGWLDDREKQPSSIFLRQGKGVPESFPFLGASSELDVLRVYRSQVCFDLNVASGEYPRLGVVAWLPFKAEVSDSICIGFDKSLKGAKSLLVYDASDDKLDIGSLLGHSGYAMLNLAERHKDDMLISVLEVNGISNQIPGAIPAANIDHAIIVDGRALVLNGWIGATTSDIHSITLLTRTTSVPLKPSLQRVYRPDVTNSFPALLNESLGFLCIVDAPDDADLTGMRLVVRTDSGRSTLRIAPETGNFSTISTLLASVPNLIQPFRHLYDGCAALQSIPGFSERLRQFLHANFLARFSTLPMHVDNPSATIAAVDRVYALDDGGLLFYGWRFDPGDKPLSVSVVDANGTSVDVTKRFFPVYRVDAGQSLRPRFPAVSDRCGYICHAEMSTKPGEARALRFEFADNKEVWLRLPSTLPTHDGLQLIKEMLGQIPSPDRIRSELYELFNTVLGKPIEHVYKHRKQPTLDVQERQFGIAPSDSKISVVVPLYGRYDFMRHQLAHFVNDADFNKCDLIYVVDDPTIVESTLDSAAYCHQLFGIPFRVVWYGANLGFAGANNIGARCARGNVLMLLNSDVLPQHTGWLNELHTALLKQPKSGAVGPLLEFGDGSIQHAGMVSRRDPMFPGFLMNNHVLKGLTWSDGEKPRKVSMLTAACLMLRKADFLGCGGFDEGYIIGDFEDSDLCLQLRKQGKQLWLVPAARLWHLERQSQNLNNVAGVRQLLTLYNGWRYHQKILGGSIANPEVSE